MIKVDFVLTRSDGVEIHRHYSDDHRYIIQNETGIIFESAEDITPCPYTYSEGEYFEWYVDEQLKSTYTDERIEASITCKTKNDLYSSAVGTIAEIDLDLIDSEIIS